MTKFMVFDSSTGEVYKGYFDKLIWDIANTLNWPIDKVKAELFHSHESEPIVFGKYSAWQV